MAGVRGGALFALLAGVLLLSAPALGVEGHRHDDAPVQDPPCLLQVTEARAPRAVGQRGWLGWESSPRSEWATARELARGWKTRGETTARGCGGIGRGREGRRARQPEMGSHHAPTAPYIGEGDGP